KNYVFRNTIITCPLVDLYGDEKNWSQYSRFPYIWKKGPPANLRESKAPGINYHDPLFQHFLSGYKVYVCLENSYEPFWFTEKMVNAARAGCIPVYHAHPTVASKFLKGACWVDPKDFSFDARKTIEYALAQDINKFRSLNDSWLDSGILDNTTQDRVSERVCDLMVGKIHQAKEPL
ncbi:MAG TPA: glycosyltransferase family 10, partial [Pseudomonadales bacterium]|nr:glycosyltransferase family 10 [Pseudomonadales bacterium]